jgi:hypothetical protein
MAMRGRPHRVTTGGQGSGFPSIDPRPVVLGSSSTPRLERQDLCGLGVGLGESSKLVQYGEPGVYSIVLVYIAALEVFAVLSSSCLVSRGLVHPDSTASPGAARRRACQDGVSFA